MNCKKWLIQGFFLLLLVHTKNNFVSGSMAEPEHVIHKGDMIKITLRMPGRTIGSLEAVQKSGDVATPDGSFVKADGLTLLAFRTSLLKMYHGIIGYEDVQIEALIDSSPYHVVKYRLYSSASATDPATVKKNTLPPAIIFPRIFKTPLSVWKAIELEGGIPKDVVSSRIRILKQDLQRKNLDCSGKDGKPDGDQLLESGDYIFLVPDGTPLSGIFD